MTIKSTNEFQIKAVIEIPDQEPSVLLENIKLKKQAELLGKVLEAQYCVGDNFLIFLTQGSILEERLYIHYLSGNLQLIDSLELAAIYTPGIITNLAIINPDKIQFSFFEDKERWSLKILSSPRYILLGNRYPVQRRLSIFRKNWLSLKELID